MSVDKFIQELRDRRYTVSNQRDAELFDEAADRVRTLHAMLKQAIGYVEVSGLMDDEIAGFLYLAKIVTSDEDKDE